VIGHTSLYSSKISKIEICGGILHCTLQKFPKLKFALAPDGIWPGLTGKLLIRAKLFSKQRLARPNLETIDMLSFAYQNI